MVSSHYFCPNCFAQFEKGTLRLLGGLVEVPLNLKSQRPGEVRWCTSCYGPINWDAVAGGYLDCQRWAQSGGWVGLVVGAGLAVYLYGWSFWPIVGVALAGDIAGFLLFGWVERQLLKRHRFSRAEIERLKEERRLAEQSYQTSRRPMPLP